MSLPFALRQPALSLCLAAWSSLMPAAAGAAGHKLDSGTAAGAAPQTAIDRPVQQLPEILSISERESVGAMRLDRRTIDAMTTGNGDITSLLRINPSVQFDNNQQRSGNQGEIAPADISINGAKYYDNLYLMDGMSINNDINPNSNASQGTGATNNISAPPSASQGFAIDTSLLCQVTVRDSNVAAEYGRFSGGVVSADTCAPTRQFGGQASIERTRSAWMQFQPDATGDADYAGSANANAQPKFEKWTYRAALQGKLSDNVSVIGSVIRKTADIPLSGYSDGRASSGDANNKMQQRKNDNLFLRAFWKISPDISADISLLAAPGSGDYFISDAKNSRFQLASGGQGVNLGMSHPLAGATIDHRLTWNKMESSRTADATSWKGWRYSPEKNWGVQSGTGATGWMSYEGGWGDVDQRQEAIHYRGKADWAALHLLGVEHRLQAGLEWGAQRSDYRRNTAYEQYTGSVNATSCQVAGGGVDTEYCSMSMPWNGVAGRGQYLASRIMYLPGAFEVSNKTRSVFLQDEMRLNNLRLRLGARYDADDLAPESSLAPRASAFWDVFGNGDTQLEAGANRYYGRNFATYYMQSKRLSLQTTAQSRSVANGVLKDWAAPVMAGNWAWYQQGDMAIPYADETVLGLSQKWLGVTWAAKHVSRASKDEMVMHLRSAANYYWDNSGNTQARIWTLSAETDRPLHFAGTATSIVSSLDHSAVTTSHADYSDTLSDLAGDLADTILYDGKYMRWIDRPAENYNRPWTARLLLSTEIPALRLKIGNFFRFRGAHERMVATGTSVPYGDTVAAVYQKSKISNALTWDLRVNFTLPRVAREESYINLSIENVLNRANPLYGSGNQLAYEKGRQFLVEIGYRF